MGNRTHRVQVALDDDTYKALQQDAYYNYSSLSTTIYRRLRELYFDDSGIMRTGGLGGDKLRPKGRGAISTTEPSVNLDAEEE